MAAGVTRVSVPASGRTVFAHVEKSMADGTAVMIAVGREIRSGKKMSKAKRIELWRELAGVVSDVESVRLWLECGAPK